MMNLHGLKRYGRLGIALSVLLAMLWGTPALGFQFNLGEVDGSYYVIHQGGYSYHGPDGTLFHFPVTRSGERSETGVVCTFRCFTDPESPRILKRHRDDGVRWLERTEVFWINSTGEFGFLIPSPCRR